ncbi:MAG TPA: DUF4340 domain-containing protein [Deltaproteobacteria bacterium]|nr:DUF4340 domain-containing protein [Deltaproteobacteria bacterium]HQI80523.1 DUF4340 domain-containing protein [Deltaproteobacteria bacterium]
MKIRKEYLLLALLIASSIGYLLFQKADRLNYRLPILQKVTAQDITRIEVVRDQESYVLSREGASWLISPRKWRVDQTKASEMTQALSELAITDLVSESGGFERYELDNKGKAVLKAYAGQKLVRELVVGKAAPTFNHTYVMLPGDRKVYLAGGDLPRLFLAPASELRDMLVFSLTPAEITRMDIEHAGVKTTLTKVEDAPPAGTDIPEGTKLYTWKDQSGTVVDKAQVDSFLAGLSKVYCGEYLDDAAKERLVSPVTSLVLTGSRKQTLSIFARDNDRIPALSTETASPFVLPDYKYEEMDKFLRSVTRK